MKGLGERTGGVVNSNGEGVTMIQVLREIVELWNHPSLESLFNDQLDDFLEDSDSDDLPKQSEGAEKISDKPLTCIQNFLRDWDHDFF